ncbi:MAG: hypothetical protein AAFV80_24465, partial [Bacteroidota bacterium]
IAFDCSAIYRKVKQQVKQKDLEWLQSLRIHFGPIRSNSFPERFQIQLEPQVREVQFLSVKGFEVQIFRNGHADPERQWIEIAQFGAWLEVQITPFRHQTAIKSYRQFNRFKLNAGGKVVPNVQGVFETALSYPTLARCPKQLLPDNRKLAFEQWVDQSVQAQREADFYVVRIPFYTLLLEKKAGSRDGVAADFSLDLLQRLSQILGVWSANYCCIGEQYLFVPFCRKTALISIFERLYPEVHEASRARN